MQSSKESFEKEIAELEARLAEKKEAAAKARNLHIEDQEKALLKEVLQETEVETAQEEGKGNAEFPAPAPTSQSTSQAHPADEQSKKQAKHYVDVLVKRSFEKGIHAALAEARKSKNPYLIDLFHDTLVDEYYQKLIEARKLKQD